MGSSTFVRFVRSLCFFPLFFKKALKSISMAVFVLFFFFFLLSVDEEDLQAAGEKNTNPQIHSTFPHSCISILSGNFSIRFGSVQFNFWKPVNHIGIADVEKPRKGRISFQSKQWFVCSKWKKRHSDFNLVLGINGGCSCLFVLRVWSLPNLQNLWRPLLGNLSVFSSPFPFPLAEIKEQIWSVSNLWDNSWN